MELVEGEVELLVRRNLSRAFGLVIDGWTSAVVHRDDLYAVFAATDALPANQELLSFSPLDDEMDLGSRSLLNFIADTLKFYERPWESVLFLMSVNCSINQYIGSRCGIPFIECASHKFNLAVNAIKGPSSGLV
jgi:hypothetical protein